MTESQAIPAPETVQQPRKSKGEKLFDFLVYGLMNYVGTFVTTILIADELKYGKGKPLFTWCEQKLKGLMVSEKTARSAIMTSVLMPGGSVMIAPLHALEKKRTRTVARFNQWLGDTTDQKAIAEEVPQQTWGSLVKGRLVAWGTVFCAMLGAQSLVGETGFTNFSKRIAHQFSNLLRVPAAAQNESSRIFRYGELGALDLFATAASVTLLYVSSKFFAQRREEHKEYVERHPTVSSRASYHAQADDVPETAAMPSTAIEGERALVGGIQKESLRETVVQR